MSSRATRSSGNTTTGDGELTALQFLQALRPFRKAGLRTGILLPPVSTGAYQCGRIPRSRRQGCYHAGSSLRHAIAQMEQELAGEDVFLIRPSGTEALIRVMVEAKTTEVARKVAEDLADLIKILSEKIQF